MVSEKAPVLGMNLFIIYGTVSSKIYFNFCLLKFHFFVCFLGGEGGTMPYKIYVSMTRKFHNF